MLELIDAKTAAKNTAAVRNRACNELKTRIINKINAAIANGAYRTHENLPNYWTVEELESFWHYFSDKGYKLSIAGIYDFTKAAEFFITHDYLDITISWGDAS